MYEFKLPDLGEGMQEAEIRRWLVQPGDIIKLDQPMVEVETDKAVVEIPSPIAGRVANIRVQAGQVAQLGEVLVILETNAVTSSRPTSGAAQGSIAVAAQPTTQTASPTTKQRVLAAPAVRKRAFELNVDLEQVTPSQPNGRVTLEDVQAYAAQ